jgi:hypothetical protein
LSPFSAVFGHAAGAAAALALHSQEQFDGSTGHMSGNTVARSSVHDVNVTALQDLLLSQKQLLKAVPASKPLPPPTQPLAAVEIGSCDGPSAIATFNTTTGPGGGKLLLLGA